MESNYQVAITHLANGQCDLQIARRGSVSALLSWTGETARRIVAWARLVDGQALNKHDVRELAVAGAAASRSEGVSAHCPVEKAVKDRQGSHLSEDELLAICVAEHPGLAAESIRATLQKLAEQHRIQRIVVDCDRVFYDANTQAHLHVFDRESGQLFDAPDSGVIFASR